MAVVSPLNRVDYTADGILTTYAFTFPVYTTTDLKVYITVPGQSAVLKVLGTHYTQTDANLPGGTVGGSITLSTTATSTNTITLIRTVPYTQPTVFTNLDRADAKTAFEKSFDRGVMLAQQNAESLNRAILWPLNANTASNLMPDPTVTANRGLSLIITSTGSGIGVSSEFVSGSITVPLTVLNGGTGVTSLTTNAVYYGQGTSPMASAGVGATGTVFTANAGAPSWSGSPTFKLGLQLGLPGTDKGYLDFTNDANGFLLRLQAGITGTTGTYILPTTMPTANNMALVNASFGVTSAMQWSATPPGSFTAGTAMSVSPFPTNTSTTTAHGLGAVPAMIVVKMTNTIADSNWAPGDIIYIPVSQGESGGGRAYGARADGTNIYFVGSNTADTVMHFNKTTRAFATLTNANWNLSVVVYRLN